MSQSRYGHVTVVDALERSPIRLDFDLRTSALFLLENDLIVRTKTGELIIVARLRDCVQDDPAARAVASDGTFVAARTLLRNAKALDNVLEMFSKL